MKYLFKILHYEMPFLAPKDRELLQKLLIAQSYALLLALYVKGSMDHTKWRNRLIGLLAAQHDAIFDMKGDLPSYSLEFILGINIDTPPYEKELHVLPTSA